MKLIIASLILATQLVTLGCGRDPVDTASFHLKLGDEHLKKGEIDAAITEYKRGLQLDPKMPELHNNLALPTSSRTGLTAWMMPLQNSGLRCA